MFKVPRYLIAKKTILGGQRGDKLVLLPKPVVASPNIIQGYGRRRRGFVEVKNVGRVQETSDSLIPIDLSMNFLNWEYRFWCLEMHGTMGSATCRRCEIMLHDEEPRRKHLNVNQCSTKLLDAYELLLRDKKCVVCDSFTANKKWGVPLCLRTQCMLNFMHQEAVPQALLQALLLIDSRRVES
jgi:hypothetical protein